MKWGILLIPPFVFALPFPPPPFNQTHFKTQLTNATSTTEAQDYPVLTNIHALGSSIFSQVLGIKTDSMPGYLCIKNTSEIYLDNEKIDPLKVLDKEGGAISVSLLSDGQSSKIYVPIASSTCIYPHSEQGFAKLNSQIEIRGVIPLANAQVTSIDGVPMIQVQQYEQSTVIGGMEGDKGYRWSLSVYTRNLFLFYFGWIILLSAIVQIWYWLRKNN